MVGGKSLLKHTRVWAAPKEAGRAVLRCPLTQSIHNTNLEEFYLVPYESPKRKTYCTSSLQKNKSPSLVSGPHKIVKMPLGVEKSPAKRFLKKINFGGELKNFVFLGF